MTNGNGSPPGAGAPPQLNVLAQYTKDLSFENPNAPASLATAGAAAPDQHPDQCRRQQRSRERIRGDAVGRGQGRELPARSIFSFELAYAGVFRIPNVPKENLHPLVMIECPRLLVPVRARDHRDRRPRRRLPAADAGSRRFRRSLSSEHGAADMAASSRASELSLTAVNLSRKEVRTLGAGKILVPDRLVAERCDKGPMRLALGIANPRRERHEPLPPRHFASCLDADLLGSPTPGSAATAGRRSDRHRLRPSSSASSSAPCLVRWELSIA